MRTYFVPVVLLATLLGALAACSTPVAEQEECMCECDCSPDLSEEEACAMAMQSREEAHTSETGNSTWGGAIGCSNLKTFTAEGKAQIDVKYNVLSRRSGNLSLWERTVRLRRADQGWYVPTGQ